jgi:hypothetical protein
MLALLFLVREVVSSILDTVAEYPEEQFSLISLVSSKNLRQSVKTGHDRSFPD